MPRGRILKAPFPYFGGKSRVADEIWRHLGDCNNYVEPFAGSIAVLLNRPHTPKTETVNDLDGFICNFWRSIQSDPEQTAHYADWPVSELDLHSRHRWLIAEEPNLSQHLMDDPEYFDPKIAGWWVWGICAWIGAGWCQTESARLAAPRWGGERGVHKTSMNIPKLASSDGEHRRSLQLPMVGNAGRGIHAQRGEHLLEWFADLQKRLRNVRVCCGDWSRVVTPSVTWKQGTTGVFLDPPYAANRAAVYSTDSFIVATQVSQWCADNGSNPLLRIVLTGYEGEHNQLEGLGWEKLEWSANGGYGNQGETTGKSNKKLERIWISPYCVKGGLF